MQVLIGILQRRIELDKEVLFQFNTIKHEAGLVDMSEKNPTIAPTLMKFQRGCHQVQYSRFTKKRNNLKCTTLGREPVSIIHYTRSQSNIERPTKNYKATQCHVICFYT